MSNMAKSDEIDEVLSSVRSFVAHKEQQKIKASQRLVLMPGQRIGPDGVPIARSGDEAADTAEASNVLILETDTPADREGLEATIAELEAAVTAQSDDWEPDEGEDFDARSSWAMSAFETPIEDTVEAATAHLEKIGLPAATPAKEPKEERVKVEPAPDTLAELTAAAGIDHEMLRTLIAATVHEELGGELGERITQNVRKLVRREINRVLAAHDLNTD